MISKTSGDGRRPSDPLVATDDSREAQAFVLGAEVVHATNQVHKWFQGFRVADQSSTAPHQDRQAGAEGSVQSLDESGIELGSAMALGQQSLGRCETSSPHTPGDVDHAFALVALDHLADVNVWPGDQPGTPAFAIREWAAKH